MGSPAASRGVPCRTTTTRAAAGKNKERGDEKWGSPRALRLMAVIRLRSRPLSPCIAGPRVSGPAGRDQRPVLYLHVRGRWPLLEP